MTCLLNCGCLSQFGVKWVVNILLMSSPIGTIYRECTLFYCMLEFQLSCFGILERYIRPRIFAFIRTIICARRSYVRLVNHIFGILTRELYSGSYQIRSTFTLAICIYRWVMLLLVSGCITRLILVSSTLFYTIGFPSFVFFLVMLYLACVLCTQYSCIIVICTTCFCPYSSLFE